MLAHAIIDQNLFIISQYLRKGVSLSLFHFRVLARPGNRIPTKLGSIFSCVDCFKRFGQGDEDDEDDIELLGTGESLLAEAKQALVGKSPVASVMKECNWPSLESAVHYSEVSLSLRFLAQPVFDSPLALPLLHSAQSQRRSRV